MAVYRKLIIRKVLSGTGDAMGFWNQKWEFNYKTESIHKEMMDLTEGKGVLALRVSNSKKVSDDTVMQLATAEALVSGLQGDELLDYIALKYVECMDDMDGRAPGPTTISAINKVKKAKGDWRQVMYNDRGGGCGASMRASSIGLLYPKEEDLINLLIVSIESGRMTHHHPTGYLGAYTAALFTSYAIRNIEPKYWANKFLETMDKVKEYIKSQERDVQDNLNSMDYFIKHFKNYIELRHLPTTKEGYGVDNDTVGPVFPDNYDYKVHDEFIRSVAFSNWGGSSGHDSVLIAYDALLFAKNDWEKICMYGILHEGDNDSTGAIVGAFYGALYGFENVPDNHHVDLEYRDRLEKVGTQLYTMAQGNIETSCRD